MDNTQYPNPPVPPGRDPHGDPHQAKPRQLGWWMVIAVLGVFLLAILAWNLASGTWGEPTDQGVGAPTESAVSVHSSAVEATTTSSAPTATAAATRDAPPGARLSLAGNGSRNSGEFATSRPWVIRWTTPDCGAGLFAIYVWQGDHVLDTPLVKHGDPQAGETNVYVTGNHLHLQISGGCTWTVKVQA